MSDSERMRSLREQRAALVVKIEDLRTSAFTHVTLPPMERALAALDDLIARETAASDG